MASERNRFLVALAMSLAAIGLIANPAGGWSLGLSALVVVSLMAFGFAVLHGHGPLRAVAASLGLGGISLFALRVLGGLDALIPWLAALLAAAMIFGLGGHILRMAAQALRRGILNQHVLVEMGALAGAAGGISGLVVQRPDYPTAPFFAVAVMVLTYHIFFRVAVADREDAQLAGGQETARLAAGYRARAAPRPRRTSPDRGSGDR